LESTNYQEAGNAPVLMVEKKRRENERFIAITLRSDDNAAPEVNTGQTLNDKCDCQILFSSSDK